MKLLKNNFYDIVKLFINQVGITIFSFFIYTAVASMFSDAESRSAKELVILFLLSLFATLFYFALIYTVAWDYGAKDKIRIDSGRQECDKLKGFKLALYANAINYFFAIIGALVMLIHTFAENDFCKTVGSLFVIILRFIASMYHGMLTCLDSVFRDINVQVLVQSVGYVIAITLAVFVTHFGYTRGLKEKRFFKPKPKQN